MMIELIIAIAKNKNKHESRIEYEDKNHRCENRISHCDGASYFKFNYKKQELDLQL